MARTFGPCGEIIVQGSGAIQLAPDLNYISDKNSGTTNYIEVTGIDGSSGFAPALSLTGKYSVYLLAFTDLVNENVTVRLTVDGVVIFNSSATAAGNDMVIFGSAGGSNSQGDNFQCESSLLLEIQTTTDTNCSLRYLARPIL